MNAHVSPAKASDQHAHQEGAHQASDGEDGHGERVHEGQVLLGEACSIPSQHRPVVKVLDVLREEGWKDDGGGKIIGVISFPLQNEGSENHAAFSQ